jgi:2-keto-4-pentenoate hydratase/2-oxohepta-3-ene-1,7-dioic acid hydratase in catechol pathway
MKLVTYSTRPEAEDTQPASPIASVPPAALSIDNPTPGVLLDNEVADLSSLGYPTLLKLIEAGQPALDEVTAKLPKAPRISLSSVILHAPIPRPPRVFGIGLNYLRHAVESNMAVPPFPVVFLKLSSSVVGPDVPIILPRLSTQPDYEAELAFVIGKPGYQIPAASAMDYVLGYTIVNDVSARDIQLSTSQWNLGKSFPTFTPIGPAITTADEIADPHNLNISLTIDGETLQDSNTSDLIFKIPALIAYISSITPLEAGDIVSTGTPEGVGLGRTPKRWLKPNEEVIVTIEQLGSLRNPTVAE